MLYIFIIILSIFLLVSCDVIARGYFPKYTGKMDYSADFSGSYLDNFPSDNVNSEFAFKTSPFSTHPDILVANFTNRYTENSRIFAFNVNGATLDQLISVDYQDSSNENYLALYNSPILKNSTYNADNSFFMNNYQLVYSAPNFKISRISNIGNTTSPIDYGQTIYNSDLSNMLLVTTDLKKIDDSTTPVTYGINFIINVQKDYDNGFQLNPFITFDHIFIGSEGMRRSNLLNYDGINDTEFENEPSAFDLKNTFYEQHIQDSRAISAQSLDASPVTSVDIMPGNVKYENIIAATEGLEMFSPVKAVQAILNYNRTFFYSQENPVTPKMVNDAGDNIYDIYSIPEIIRGYDYIIDDHNKVLIIMILLDNKIVDTIGPYESQKTDVDTERSFDHFTGEIDYIDIFRIYYENGFESVFRDPSILFDGLSYNDNYEKGVITPEYFHALDSALRDDAIVDYKRFHTQLVYNYNKLDRVQLPSQFYFTNTGLILSYDFEYSDDDFYKYSQVDFLNQLRYFNFDSQSNHPSDIVDNYQLDVFEAADVGGLEDDTLFFFDVTGENFYVYSENDKKLSWSGIWWN